jgi:hypothetical protein
MKPRAITITALLLAAAGIAGAQNRRDGDRPQRPPMPPIPPILAFFDSNRDGEISEDEIDAASDKLAELDRNDDGKITRDEIRPPRGEGDRPPRDGEPKGPPPNGRQVPPLIGALDADKDGKISAEEMENAPEALKELDKNGDGELTPDEFGPPRPPRFHPDGPPPGEEGEAQAE